jgi:NAD(P)-dependent dehydrogenase (short-subunit alcohol dehydrogenase family)
MKNIIVITGASSGIGALAARALAMAGHTVYASMRETTGRNAAQVEAAKQFWIMPGFTRIFPVHSSRHRSCVLRPVSPAGDTSLGHQRFCIGAGRNALLDVLLDCTRNDEPCCGSHGDGPLPGADLLQAAEWDASLAERFVRDGGGEGMDAKLHGSSHACSWRFARAGFVFHTDARGGGVGRIHSLSAMAAVSNERAAVERDTGQYWLAGLGIRRGVAHSACIFHRDAGLEADPVLRGDLCQSDCWSRGPSDTGAAGRACLS